MLIALDYDDTYTRDPAFWNIVITQAKIHGHTVVLATMRHETEGDCVVKALHDRVDRIIFTGRKAKGPFLAALGLNVSVWIDDNPTWILTSACAEA